MKALALFDYCAEETSKQEAPPGAHEAAPDCSASEQALHAVAPVCVELNLPAGHATHTVNPTVSVYVPVGQG